MLNIENLTNTEINLNRLKDIANSLTNRDIDLTICDNALIQQYNQKYRNIDKATDVLSFPIDSDFDNMPLGSIVISYDFVKKKSKEFGHQEIDELHTQYRGIEYIKK